MDIGRFVGVLSSAIQSHVEMTIRPRLAAIRTWPWLAGALHSIEYTSLQYFHMSPTLVFLFLHDWQALPVLVGEMTGDLDLEEEFSL